jgi:hypothetical protein
VYNLTAGRVNLKLLKMKKVMFTVFVVGLGLTANVMAQSVCQTIGSDSLSLYQNQYYTGPGITGASCAIHTESKWIATTGVDSIYFKTVQHRLYDNSKIYNENNQLIWSWNGESVPGITWYDRYHTLNIAGNDSIRIEVYQGYNNFCVTRIQLLSIYCTSQCSQNLTISPLVNQLQIGATAIFTATTTDPNSSYVWQSNFGQGFQTLNNYGDYSGVNTNTLNISNVQLANHNQPVRAISTSGNCVDTSNIATIQIADTCITNVTVYDTLLTTVTDTLIINTTLSLPAPNNENTILIYPNPASDHITIDNGNFAAMAGYSIKIENNAGQQVFQSAINQAQFYMDLSTWTGNGLYFVHLIDPQNNTVTVRKIVLQ